MELYNRGEINARYKLSTGHGPFSDKWSFAPDQGVLEYQDVHTLTMTFCSDVLGEFKEKFVCEIEGGAEPLTLDFNGRVRAAVAQGNGTRNGQPRGLIRPWRESTRARDG